VRGNRYIQRYTSPKSKRQGCLCADRDTYSRKCCKGKLINQGIGDIGGSYEESFFLLKEDGGFLLKQDNDKIIL
jgi:hypothetical protein